jgi:hypothetical protein
MGLEPTTFCMASASRQLRPVAVSCVEAKDVPAYNGWIAAGFIGCLTSG